MLSPPNPRPRRNVARAFGKSTTGPGTALLELVAGQLHPVAVGSRAGRTGMKDLSRAQLRKVAGQRFDSRKSKSADAHEPFRLQCLDDATQMFLARGEQSLDLALRQFVGCDVRTGFTQEGERAIIHDVVFAKKVFRGAEALREQSPETLSAHLAARAVKAEHWP